MEEFFGCVLIWVLIVLVPPYFLWFMGCIIQGEWLSLSLFQWEDGCRILAAIWFLLGSLISFACIAETIR